MKILFFAFLCFSFLSSNTNNSLLNEVQGLIQKEEYLALALNKYILKTKTLPTTIDTTTNEVILDWSLLLNEEYLGVNFNKKNPFKTNSDIKVKFDNEKNAYIFSIVENISDYKNEYKYLYNLYNNANFRINTQAPKDNESNSMILGLRIKYLDIQEKIVSLLNQNQTILFDWENCTKNQYFYELKNNELIYKYCKENYSVEVYAKEPIYVENFEDLSIIKTQIGSKASVKNGTQWFEYYYQGDVSTPWIPLGLGEDSYTKVMEDVDIQEIILNYKYDSKDIILRNNGGCILANGDIYCFGENSSKKAGVENYGQLDNTINADYTNSKTMLKVQILDNEHKNINWYNSPYRLKFSRFAMNSKNVCAISEIFEDDINKQGGELFCNGSLSPTYFEDLLPTQGSSSILKRNKYINDNNIYLVDIAMVDDATVLLDEDGDLYSFGLNNNGVLGQNSVDETLQYNEPIKINFDSDLTFQRVYALRDTKTFGAIDQDGYFWIWGERKELNVLKPTMVDEDIRFDKDSIFVNSNEFVLKSTTGSFYKTTPTGIEELLSIPSSALSVSIFDDLYLYVDENKQLKGSSSLYECKNSDATSCDGDDEMKFNDSFNFLNDLDFTVNAKTYGRFSSVGIFKNSDDKKFVCATSGYVESFKLYCWGHVSRSVPILSTSLYDTSKISTNKLFVNESADLANAIALDEFLDGSELFLKYPTYISGFDYLFYFK